MAYLSYPAPAHEAKLPECAVWVHALDYTDLRYARPRPTDTQVYDGLLRAEARDAGFTGGWGVATGFGRDAGDRARYTVRFSAPMPDAVLLVRARLARGERLETSLGTIAGTGEFTLTRFAVGDIAAGTRTLELVSKGGAAMELDGFVYVPASSAAQVRFEPAAQDPVPEELVEGARAGSLMLKYRDLERWYGIGWNYALSEVRQFIGEDLDTMLHNRLHDHVSKVLRGPGKGHFTNAFLRPIPLDAKATRVVYGVVCQGTREQVRAQLAAFSAMPGEACEAVYAAARSKRMAVSGAPAGARYEFALNRMAAANATNVTFPLYMRRHYIRHDTPTPWAPMLYSWDAGFTGLGLLELDVERAVGCLNTYLTREGDRFAAFILHGTPLPVQIFLYLELWQRTQNEEMLAHYYPRIRQYHNFLAGKLGSSSTRRLKSQLLQTWDYFYNTGWDDYPPQVYMHANKLQRFLAAPTTTAHAIRTARILSMAARALGRTGDLAGYEEDIATFTRSLQRYSWDEQAGYYGYVMHNEAGQPTGLLRHKSGANFNMGMCGAYPLFSGGVCTPEQERRILGQMMSEEHLWTRIGMTTVDQSAPYYTPDGYWNGAVWMPHQWFVWKALLDLGHGDEAWRIARTGLDVWSQEVERSYLCLEHFMVASGRGAGLHHMTGLSNPVLLWFNAYYKPGRLTAGYDTWIARQRFTDDNRRLEAELRTYGAAGRKALVLAGMRPGGRYRANWNGREVTPRVTEAGALELALDRVEGAGRLVVEAV
jgi:hypothetical protein